MPSPFKKSNKKKRKKSDSPASTVKTRRQSKIMDTFKVKSQEQIIAEVHNVKSKIPTLPTIKQPTKLEEKNVEGGESVFLHLDDWEHCKELSENPVGKQNFLWDSPKSKNVDYEVKHPVFSKDSKDRPQISYIDQFPEPQSKEQGNFLQKLSDALEESKNKITLSLPVGSTVFANNYFWLHGRKTFKENKNLSRELLRIRGSFFN